MKPVEGRIFFEGGLFSLGGWRHSLGAGREGAQRSPSGANEGQHGVTVHWGSGLRVCRNS